MHYKGLYVTLTTRIASLRRSIATPEKGATRGFALVTPADCLEGDKSARREAGRRFIVQELCESRGGRPGLSVLTSFLVSVDVKLY